MVSMSSAVAVVRLSGRMCRKESLSGIGEAVLGEEVGLDHPCPEDPSHGILNDPKIGFDEDFRRLRQKLPAIRLHCIQNWVYWRFQVVASKPARYAASYSPKLGSTKISGCCVKNCSMSRNTWSCRFPEISATCKLVMAEIGKVRQKKSPMRMAGPYAQGGG